MNTAIAYEYESEQGVIIFGSVLVKGCPPNNMKKNHAWFTKHVQEAAGNKGHKIKEFIKLASVSMPAI